MGLESDASEAARGAALARPPEDPAAELPWIRLGPGRRYFQTETGDSFLVIGQNDALTWPDLEGLLGRRDVPAVERHLDWLAGHGITTLRVMLEYVGDGLYLEHTCGAFDPTTVQALDDLVRLCERRGLRLLLTPFDTFFTWVKWGEHPYNADRGGPCIEPFDLLAHADGMAAVKRRIAFAVERWGGSGAIFAWDLWNEMGHHHGVGDAAELARRSHELLPVASELSSFIRGLERGAFGKTHLQTISHFGPEPKAALADLVFRHPGLDFATTHVYEPGAIDHPLNTIAAAAATARWVRHALAEIRDGRPFTDSETGPIHAYKDLGVTLPDDFDATYFRHMAWAHLASGGAGGGMRWPNRHPHTLTPSMRHAQAVMAEFARLIDWPDFASRNVSPDLDAEPGRLLAYGCADDRRLVAWFLRDRLGMEDRGPLAFRPLLHGASTALPGLSPGAYRVTAVETQNGHVLADETVRIVGPRPRLTLPPFRYDLAVAVRWCGA